MFLFPLILTIANTFLQLAVSISLENLLEMHILGAQGASKPVWARFLGEDKVKNPLSYFSVSLFAFIIGINIL